MIGDNKEFRISGKNYGACCPFESQFFKGNKPFQFISFLLNISLYPFSCGPSATWIFCWKNKDRYMSKKGKRTQYNYFFLSYMSFLVVYFPSRTFTGWKQHKGYWKYVAMYCMLLILINSRQIAFECKIVLSITTKKWKYKMSNVVFVSMILEWSSVHHTGQ